MPVHQRDGGDDEFAIVCVERRHQVAQRRHRVGLTGLDEHRTAFSKAQ